MDDDSSLTDYSVEEAMEKWLEKQLRCETVVDLSGLSNKAKRAIGDYNYYNIRRLSAEDLHKFLEACKAYIDHSQEEMKEAMIQYHEEYMGWRNLKYPEFIGQDYYLHELKKQQGEKVWLAIRSFIAVEADKAGLDKKVKGKKEHDNDVYILTECIDTYELLLFKKQHADGCPAIIEKQLLKAGIVLNNWIELTKDLMRQDPEHKNPELGEDELRQAEFTYEKLKKLIGEAHLHHRSVNPTNLQ